MANAFQQTIRHNDRVTILIPAGRTMRGVEYKAATGRAVMHSANGGWVLNMGGRHGIPAIATESNTLEVNGRLEAYVYHPAP